MPKFQANFFLYAEDLDRAVSFYTENFPFRLLGRLQDEDMDDWAALRVDNAILWLGKQGTSSGLVLLIDSEIENFVTTLKENGVNCFIPDKNKGDLPGEPIVLSTSWGKHVWFTDSEKNVVMLFQPKFG